MPEIGPRRTPLRPSGRRALAAGALAALTLAATAALPATGQPPRLAPDPGTRSFSFPEPTPVDAIYRAIGEAFGIDVQFHPLFRPGTLTLELDEVDAIGALDQLATVAGHFLKPLGERSILVMADTPQNRRTYEDVVVRTFTLDEADPGEVLTVLRSLAGLKHGAVDEPRRTVTVRDVADKVAVMADLVAVADRRPGEVEVAVELLEVDRARLAEWLAAGPGAAGGTHRLPPGELAALERATGATALVRPHLALIGNRPASYRLRGGAPEAPFRTFEIELTGRIHPHGADRPEITLDLEIATRELHPESAAAPAEERLIAGELTSSVRLADGETFLVTDLGTRDLRAPIGRAGSALVVALTPRVIAAPEAVPTELEEMWVGSEASVRYGDARRTSLP